MFVCKYLNTKSHRKVVRSARNPCDRCYIGVLSRCVAR